MANFKFTGNIMRAFHRTGLKLKKHSPEIMVIGGCIGAVASAVMACKATTKAGDILEKAQEKIDAIHYIAEHPETHEGEYSEKDVNQALAITYIHTGLDFVKLYGPAVLLGAASITSILAGHNMLQKRHAGLVAAYTAVDNSFKDYRNRVIDRFGEGLDRELRLGIKAKEVEVTEIDENGEEKKVKATVNVTDPNKYSDYARCFDCGNEGWQDDAEFNLMYLRQVQKYATDALYAKGHLFLNEVYDMLGIPRTRAGNVVGWYYDENKPTGDNFVDFRIYDINSEAAQRFVNGYEKSIWLDFNVDGPILDLI